jgi:hypothetical protein
MSLNCRHEIASASKGVASLCAALVVSGVLFLPGKGMATPIMMNDEGSTATVDPDSSTGMTSWTVNGGQNQLVQQSFWYRTGNGLANPVNSISTASVNTSNGSDGINEVTAGYNNGQVQLSIDYLLLGSGVNSGGADLTESVMFKNISASSFTLNLYQYSNFNLLGVSHDTVQLFGTGSGGSAPYYYVQQANGSTAIQEGIVSPFATYGETAFSGTTLNELNNTSALQLNDNAGPTGPGDVTWAFQWTITLAPGAMLDLSKDLNMSIAPIPEPSTMALMVLGLGACGLARRRQSS